MQINTVVWRILIENINRSIWPCQDGHISLIIILCMCVCVADHRSTVYWYPLMLITSQQSTNTNHLGRRQLQLVMRGFDTWCMCAAGNGKSDNVLLFRCLFVLIAPSRGTNWFSPPLYSNMVTMSMLGLFVLHTLCCVPFSHYILTQILIFLVSFL